MAEVFCSNCRTVGHQGGDACCQCGQKVVKFNPCKHGRDLISPANGWHQIHGKWDDHPIFEETSQRLYDDGCCGAASHINAFIQALIDKVEALSKPTSEESLND